MGATEAPNDKWSGMDWMWMWVLDQMGYSKQELRFFEMKVEVETVLCYFGREFGMVHDIGKVQVRLLSV